MAAARRTALIAFCRSLSHATEDIKWGNDQVFSVGAKMFACFENNGKDAQFSCKVPEEDFGALTSIEGIKPAPYAARYHWVYVDDPKVLPENEALALIRGSYELVKAKLPTKLQKQIDAGPLPKESVKKAAAPKKSAAPKAVAAAPKKSPAAPKKSAASKKSPAPKKSAAPRTKARA